MDFTLAENLAGTPQLVYEVFKKYQPLIVKKARYYQSVSRNKIDSEDFKSDVYCNLHHFLSYLNVAKIKNPERFTFITYVKYAIHKTLKDNMAYSRAEVKSLDETNEEGSPLIQIPCTKYESNILKLNIKPFYKELSPRQRSILKMVHKGYIYKDIQQQLNTSYGIIPIEMRKIRKIAKTYF